MRWEHLTFVTTGDLIAAARASVAEGLSRRVHRDDSEPTLAWMDRLARTRSDWLSAVGVALHALAKGAPSDSSAAGRESPADRRLGDQRIAVTDFFATAEVAPALMSVLDTLVELEGWPPCSVPGRHHGGHGAMTLAELRAPLAELASGLSTPGWIDFDLKPRQAMDISTPAERRGAVLACVKIGRQRTVCGFDAHTLGWLRHLAFFNHALIPEVSDHLQALVAGTDPKGWLCAAEYVALAHDAHWLTTLLERWLAEQPPAMALRVGRDDPDGWPVGGRQWSFAELGLGPDPRVGDLVSHALERAKRELATAPVHAEPAPPATTAAGRSQLQG